MPNNWSIVDATFPTFRGDESPKEQIASLVDYMKVLTEQLKYSLDNLGTNNWNATELKNLSDDVAKLLAEDIEKLAKLYDDLNVKYEKLSLQLGKLQDNYSTLAGELQTINGNLNVIRQDITVLQGGTV